MIQIKSFSCLSAREGDWEVNAFLAKLKRSDIINVSRSVGRTEDYITVVYNVREEIKKEDD